MGRGSGGTVTPYRQDGRAVFVASFKDHRYKRVTRSLGTTEEPTAKQICASIEQLQRGAVTKIDEVPVTIHPKAFQLYFGTESLSELISHFLAYVLWKTLAQWMRRGGLGDAPRTLLEELARIKSGDVLLRALPKSGGPERVIRLRCVTTPDAAQKVLLNRMGLKLPRRLRRIDQVAQM